MPLSDSAFLLAPSPRRLTPASGSFSLTHGGMIALQGDPAEILPALQALERDLGPAWMPCVASAASDAAIALTIAPAGAMPAQGYHLRIDRRRVVLTAADRAGLFYGIMTLRQLGRARAGHWPACMIEDAPDFPTRGVMLDISRDKVPTLDTLFALNVRKVASRYRGAASAPTPSVSIPATPAIWNCCADSTTNSYPTSPVGSSTSAATKPGISVTADRKTPSPHAAGAGCIWSFC